MTTTKRAAHLFRRDLRLEDNTALLAALQQSEEVYPVFVFDPRQIESHDYRSLPALQFMLEALEELDAALKKRSSRLYVLHGQSEAVLADFLQEQKIEALYFNRDYTPFSRKRDASIEKRCKELGVACHQMDDCLLTVPGSILTQAGDPYSVYTPFFRRASKETPDKPRRNNFRNFAARKSKLEWKYNAETILGAAPRDLFINGHRETALRILRDIEKYKNYEEERNIPAQAGTTGLSAHHKFGTISIRESYWSVCDALGSGHTLIQELYWRDFFHHVAWHYPRVFQGAFHQQYNALEWSDNQEEFERWCQGETGYPIVDAGMRELNATGFMHNRVRMIVASFLVKDLHISWQWGERYFAQQLIDYDPCVNNGNWQWAASTGCDAQPYFRIFNPWSQQKKFDAAGEYIRRHVAELEGLDGKALLKLEDTERPRPSGYPEPMVDHGAARVKAKQMFEAVKK